MCNYNKAITQRYSKNCYSDENFNAKGGASMKFRKVAALSLASVMALSLAACGGNSGGDSKGTDDTETKTEGEKTDGEKTESSSSSGAELSVSIWDTNQEPGIKEILADFTEQTGIKTKLSVVKWDEYWTR